MKILKPGRVEMRKFVCHKCGCIFVANEVDFNSGDSTVKIKCPCCWQGQRWDNGEPYEEPTQDTDADAKKIVAIAQQWLRDDRTASLWMLADKLIANGVTFREG